MSGANSSYEMPPTKPASDPFEDRLAWMLVAIENNYRRETSGWGSRFEGERLEVVQARTLIRHVKDEVSRQIKSSQAATDQVLADFRTIRANLLSAMVCDGCRAAVKTALNDLGPLVEQVEAVADA